MLQCLGSIFNINAGKNFFVIINDNLTLAWSNLIKKKDRPISFFF